MGIEDHLAGCCAEQLNQTPRSPKFRRQAYLVVLPELSDLNFACRSETFLCPDNTLTLVHRNDLVHFEQEKNNRATEDPRRFRGTHFNVHPIARTLVVGTDFPQLLWPTAQLVLLTSSTHSCFNPRATNSEGKMSFHMRKKTYTIQTLWQGWLFTL